MLFCGIPASKINTEVVTPSENTFSGSLIIFCSWWCFNIDALLSFSNFLSGKINAHIVCCGTLSNTFSTIFRHPYFLSNGGFIKTLVIFLSLIHSPAFKVLLSNCSKFVFPSLCISILAQASANISLSNSIPNNCWLFIFLALSVCIPPDSLIILLIDLTKKPPDPQAASKTLSSWWTSINLYIKEVTCSGVNTWPLSDFFLYLLNSLKKIPITSSPFQ